MKTRVLFCIENFQHGGINKALENIISFIDKKEYEIGIFVVNQEDGPYKNIFAPYLQYPSDKLLNSLCTNYRKHSGIKKISLLALKTLRKLSGKLNRDIFELRLDYWARRISADKYDCVVAFAEGYITKFVSKINGYKVAWIHIDYKRYLTYVTHKDEEWIYSRFNHIIIPSGFSGQSFVEIYPLLTDKVMVIPNVIDTDLVKRLAHDLLEQDNRFNTNKLSIISVGRICYEKRFFEIPNIANKLREKGLNFRWYIIGDGSLVETNTLMSAIVHEGVSDCVIPLGRKNNPYPYIMQSDLLVSTSLSETFSYVVFESKTLGTPVVCADFGTAPEILKADEGVITPLHDMADVIYSVFTDKIDSLHAMKQSLSRYVYDNESIIRSIERSFIQ